MILRETNDALSTHPVGEYRSLNDPSLWMLVFSNVLFGVLFLVAGGEVAVLMWVYWSQSVIIGIFNFLRILTQKEFSTDGLKSGGRPVPHTEKAKNGIAYFFLLHYGIFHLVYFVFLLSDDSVLDIKFIFIGALIFFTNHGFSFFYNLAREKNIEKNIGTLLFYPYVRIIPMHSMIVFGLFLLDGAFSVFVFLVLKIVADCAMHVLEHYIFNKKRAEVLIKNISVV